MNLQQTIEDLEQKAAQYSDAANALRVVLAHEQPANGSAPARSTAPTNGSAPAKSASGSNGAGSGKQAAVKVAASKQPASRQPAGKKANKKYTMSPEARAKLSKLMKERYAQKKAAAGAA